MHRRLGKCIILVFLLLSFVAAFIVLKSLSSYPVILVNRLEPRRCACSKCLKEGDPYLAALLIGGPIPFLSRNSTSEGDFNWWQALQKEKHDFAFYNTTLQRLFQIIPPFSDVPRRRHDVCTSCAVVGNSGRLRWSRYGSLIDSHDIVIRMNHAHTKGFETDVGSRTTHHVFYPESATTLANTTRLVFLPFKISDLLWLQKKLNLQLGGALKAKTIANKDLVMMLSPTFMRYIHMYWLEKKGRYPSTGFLAFALSIQLCDVVDVFGFGADGDGNWNHYFEKLSNQQVKTGPHAGTNEYEFLQLLSKKKKIQLY